MNDWPSVWLLMTTYKRTEAALRTIDGLLRYLKYPNLHYHICDDGSGETDDGTERKHVAVLVNAFGPNCTWHDIETPRGDFNLGGNVNLGIKTAKENRASIYFVTQDDALLETPLDLRPYAEILHNHQSVGYIRLNYAVTGLAGEIVAYKAESLNRFFPFLRIRRSISTNHYVPAFAPALLHYRFIETYGWYPENVHPGLTETGMCNQFHKKETEDSPQVLMPLSDFPRDTYWRHIAGRAHDYGALTKGKLEWIPPPSWKG